MQAALDSFESANIDFPNNEMYNFAKFVHKSIKYFFIHSISLLSLPITIIHSEDDAIIPYQHAQLVNILRFSL